MELDVSFGSRTQRIIALVDTGAVNCIFDRSVGDSIEIDYSPGRGKDRPLSILGREHQAREAIVTLEIPRYPGTTWETLACFLHEELPLSFIGVLGQEGFLDRWVTTFNYYDGYFMLEERDSFVARFDADPADALRPWHDDEWERPTEN